MKKSFALLWIFLVVTPIFAADYIILPEVLPQIPEAEPVFNNGTINIFTKKIIHDAKYGIERLAIYAKYNDTCYSFSIDHNGGPPQAIERLEYYQFDENNSAVFLLVRKSNAGVPAGPNYVYYTPTMIIFSEEVYAIDFHLTFSPEDPPDFDIVLEPAFEGDPKFLFITLQIVGSDNRRTKVLTMENSVLKWDERLEYSRHPNVSTVNLNIRREPNLSSEVIALIGQGDTVFTLEATKELMTIGNLTDRWFKIIYDNIVGWVFGAYLRPM